MTMVVMCEGTHSSLVLPSTAMLAHAAAVGDTAVVAVESESVSAMDFADDLPQLSRLQHAEEGASTATQHAACATVMPAEVVVPAQDAAAESSERRGHTAHIEQQREQLPQPQHREQCGMEETAVEQVSAPSTTTEPPPPSSLTQQPLQSHTPPAADTSAATNTAMSGPCAYVVPLISHLDNYTASQAAIVERYKAALLEFDQVAVSRWLLAATRHLKQQEETKRELTENGQQLRQEIAEFAQKMMQWRGGSADKLARQRPRQ